MTKGGRIAAASLRIKSPKNTLSSRTCAPRKMLPLRASAHTGAAIRFPSLPLGEGGSHVSRKCETDEGRKGIPNWNP